LDWPLFDRGTDVSMAPKGIRLAARDLKPGDLLEGRNVVAVERPLDDGATIRVTLVKRKSGRTRTRDLPADELIWVDRGDASFVLNERQNAGPRKHRHLSQQQDNQEANREDGRKGPQPERAGGLTSLAARCQEVCRRTRANTQSGAESLAVAAGAAA